MDISPSISMLRLSKFITLIKIYIVLFCIFASACKASYCNNRSLGNSACIRLARYNSSQWSTCVTDVYIRQKSKGRHGCAGGQAICIYQCMLEMHGMNSGSVLSPCACSVDYEVTIKDPGLTTGKPSIALPPSCFSPTGRECGWFRTCLGRRYSCGQRFDSEIIRFPEALCTMYLNPYSELSDNGSMWVNGVRKCLQVNLVPLLRAWHETNSESCNSLTKHAITSYKHCFYSPFPGYIPTICELPLNDLWRIFWHLRQTLSEGTQHSLLAILRVIENCPEFRKANLIPGKVRKFVFIVKRSEKLRVSKFNEVKERRLLRDELGQKIAKQFCLDKDGISWFAFPRKGKNFKENTAELVFYIADKNEHMMRRRLELDTKVDLNNTVRTLVQAVRRNEMCFNVFGGKQDYQVTETTVCKDLECQSNCWKVTADLTRSSSSSCPVIRSFSSTLIFLQFLVYLTV